MYLNVGYDINYGARPLKRLVSRTIETDLSRLIIDGSIKNNDVVIVDYKDDKFNVNKKMS